MEKWPPKSAVRYAKTQNRLSPLWAPSDLGSLKRNTYATFFLTLHSLWAPSDFFFAKIDLPIGLARDFHAPGANIDKITSQKPCKVLQNEKMTSQKCCKVCQNENWPVTTMGSQRFGSQECNKYATFFSTLHSRSTPSDLCFAKIDFSLRTFECHFA